MLCSMDMLYVGHFLGNSPVLAVCEIMESFTSLSFKESSEWNYVWSLKGLKGTFLFGVPAFNSKI